MENKTWKKISIIANSAKKAAITVKVATVYFVEGVVKSLMTSLCILAGVGVSHAK